MNIAKPSAAWILFILLAALELTYTQASYLSDNYPASVIEDASLTTLKLLRKYKYPAEEHFVTTQDGYILAMHRIARPDAKPLLLMHGIQDSSATWLLMGPEQSLAYYLYSAGYDVWLGNVRGNRYSRNHTTLNPNTTTKYWNFSFHEIGYYDLPAMIDAVLLATDEQKLSYIGHSQGTTVFFIMAATRPEYNDKLHVMQALAPVAYMKNAKIPMRRLARSIINMVSDTSIEALPQSNIFFNSCFISDMTMNICLNQYWMIVGRNPQELNSIMFPVVIGHLLAGGSLKQPEHYLQMASSDCFCQYDYGATKNQHIYGNDAPPDYQLERITTPIAVYYARNDNFVSVVDAKRLIKRLPNVILDNFLPYKEWNHMDIHWGKSAPKLIFPQILQTLKTSSG